MTRAVVFDVDFTLIYPGPTFGPEGYRWFCQQHGIDVDTSRFQRAMASAAPILDDQADPLYDPEIFLGYVRRIITEMGGRGDRLDVCAQAIYDEWAVCKHFELYEDVRESLSALAEAEVRIGLLSNSHRCLDSFQSHFELRGLVSGAVSSFEHGMMKPHPSIFREALSSLGVRADEAVMVGDSVRHDVEGALAVGMAAVFLNRSGQPHTNEALLRALGVPTVMTLTELPALLPSLLPRRPLQAPAAKQMQVDVKDRLAGIPIGVEDSPEAAR